MHTNLDAIAQYQLEYEPYTPPACPWCDGPAHAPGKCPVAAALTGMPLIAELKAQIAALEARLAEYRNVNALATATLEKYRATFGALSELKEGTQ